MRFETMMNVNFVNPFTLAAWTTLRAAAHLHWRPSEPPPWRRRTSRALAAVRDVDIALMATCPPEPPPTRISWISTAKASPSHQLIELDAHASNAPSSIRAWPGSSTEMDGSAWKRPGAKAGAFAVEI